MLKAELKFESVDQLKSAHGMGTLSSKLSWKEVREVLTFKLLLINPFKWYSTIRDWVEANRLGKILAKEIQKEIDAEIIAILMASAHVETAGPEALKKLSAMVGYSE